MNENPFGFPDMKWEDVDNSYEYALEKIMTLNTAISQAKDVIRIQQEHINRLKETIEDLMAER
jgi:hypothetical protein